MVHFSPMLFEVGIFTEEYEKFLFMKLTKMGATDYIISTRNDYFLLLEDTWPSVWGVLRSKKSKNFAIKKRVPALRLISPRINPRLVFDVLKLHTSFLKLASSKVKLLKNYYNIMFFLDFEFGVGQSLCKVVLI